VKKLKFFVIIFLVSVIAIGVADFLNCPQKYIGNSEATALNQIFFSAIEEEKENNLSEEVSPEIVRAIYLTSWSAGSDYYIDYLIDLTETTEINAVVIDIKDYSGQVAYNSQIPEVEEYGAEFIKILDIESLIEKLHQKDIYTIARITVFQDPVLAKARPDLAIHSKSRLAFLSQTLSSLSLSSLWFDRSRLFWLDPSVKEVWDYNIAIAKEASKLGFDEINFDYVRFPSGGNLSDMAFPFWNKENSKREVIREFFSYLRKELPEIKLSIDLFGLAAVNQDDLGIGQVIEDAFAYFDFVCPMMYPSHYASGFLGFQNPAEYPYQVVEYSTVKASERLKAYNKLRPAESPLGSSTEIYDNDVYLRPWIQDFDLGAFYTSSMVRAEIEAVKEAAGDNFKGYMLWNPSNFYTEQALK